MAIEIPITGLASNDAVPGTYLEIGFAQGQSSGGGSSYDVLLMGNALGSNFTANTVVYGPDTAVPMTSEADAIALFGAGSELHRGVRAFMAANSSSKLYAIAVAESAGVAASIAVTFTNAATSNATVTINIGAESVTSSIVSGDSVTAIALAAVAAINGKTSLPVTASSTAGVVTVTAKQKGLRGNLIRVSARISPAAGTTVTPGAHTAMSGGTTADDCTAALATLLSERHYYIVPAAVDATQLGLVKNQIALMAQPLTGLRQRMFAGSVDSLANATTLATGLNDQRSEIVWQMGGDVSPFELAAKAAAGYSLFEASAVPRLNFNGYGSTPDDQALWDVKKPLASAGPTRAQVASALNNGLTPVVVGKSGSTSIAKRITTRSLNGSNPDYRVRDAHIVSVCDFYSDDLVNKLSNIFAGFNIGNDPAKGQNPPAGKVVTPKSMKAAVDALTRLYGDNRLFENVDTIVANTIVARSSNPTNRMGVKVPVDVADILNQIGILVSQVG